MAFRVGSQVKIFLRFDRSLLARPARVPYRYRHGPTLRSIWAGTDAAGLRRRCDPAPACRCSRNPPPFAAAAAGRPRTSAFSSTPTGVPFFWLGDTAWELFHRLNREEADHYLRNRAERRFTVIQAVALAELDGLDVPNPYGHGRSIDNDPTRPNEPTSSTSIGSSPRPTRSASTSGCCRRGATSGTRSGASVRRFHARERRGLRRVARPALSRRRSSGSSAAIGRSRTTRTGPSSRRWRAACGRATAART